MAYRWSRTRQGARCRQLSIRRPTDDNLFFTPTETGVGYVKRPALLTVVLDRWLQLVRVRRWRR